MAPRQQKSPQKPPSAPRANAAASHNPTRVQKNRAVLEVLEKAKAPLRKAIIQHSDREIIYTLCEICDNLLCGNVPLTPPQKTKLKKYQTQIRQLAQRGGGLKAKKAVLLQRGGYLLPVLLSTLASVLPMLFQK